MLPAKDTSIVNNAAVRESVEPKQKWRKPSYISRRPKALTAVSMSACISVGELASVLQKMALPALAITLWVGAVSVSYPPERSSGDKSLHTTYAPADPSVIAIALPTPDDEPVTMATRADRLETLNQLQPSYSPLESYSRISGIV